MKITFKKILLLLLTLVLCLSFGLSACEGTDSSGSGSDSTSASVSEEDPVPPPERTVEQTKLVVYEGPSLMQSSAKLSASVEGEELFVYETRVNHNRIFSYTYSKAVNQVVLFDFEGRVHMRVEIHGAEKLSDVVIRPLAYNVSPAVTGNVIEFDLEYSANYTLEYNDGTVEDGADNALHIFANPIETDPVDPDNVPKDVIYIGPGVYSAGAIPVSSGKTVYLAGGAYVYGQIRAEQVENLTVRGRGIFCGSIYDRTKASEYTLPVEIRSSKNIRMEGVAFLDPAGWAITLYKCENVTLENIKIITARANGDGISVQSCKNVTVNGGFVRSWDDSLVVKNSDRGTTDHVVFDGVTVWTDLAQSCEVGFETNGATMNDIQFRNVTILHNYHKAAMSIHNCDDADITNVTYSNITIEDARMKGDNQLDGLEDYLIDITIAYNENWTQSGGLRGTIDGVRFDNIKVLRMADSIVCRINGESSTSYVENVEISNLEIEGKRITSAEELKLGMNNYTKAILVNAGSASVHGALQRLPYTLDLKSEKTDKTVVQTKAHSGLEVPAFAILDVQELYMGVQLSTESVQVLPTHGVGNQAKSPYDDGSGPFTKNDAKAALFDGDRSTSWIAGDWTGETNEFAALTFDFGEAVSPGVIRVYLAKDSSYVYSYNIGVFVKKTAEATNFVRSVSTTEYDVSPANGNYFDIKLSATLTCVSLQLRIFRGEGMTAPTELSIAEIAFYPCSLSTTKAIVDSTQYFDVYEPNYLLDGNENTYWEADTSEGAFFIVDLGDVYNVKYFIMHLPPLLTWEPRTQEIEILVSTDGANWTVAKESTEYLFDPASGNSNMVELAESIPARYVKLVWNSNSSLGGYGAQLSELYVYGE